jgi:hypothetical protein
MKLRKSDERYTELQYQLIASLPPEILERLENECVSAASTARRREGIILLLISILVFLSAKTAEWVYNVTFYVWVSVGIVGIMILLRMESSDKTRWGLRFEAPGMEDFCLARWMKENDDSSRLRAWKGINHRFSVKAVPFGWLGLAVTQNKGGELLKSLFQFSFLWFLGIPFLIALLSAGSIVFDTDTSVYGKSNFWRNYEWICIFSIKLLSGGCFVLSVFSLFKRINPEEYGMGYEDVVSALDSKVMSTSSRRPR